MSILDTLKLFANPRRLATAAKDPKAALRTVKWLLFDMRKMVAAIGVDWKEFKNCMKEVQSNREFKRQILSRAQRYNRSMKRKGIGLGGVGEIHGVILYGIVRSVKPLIVLETGVSSGMSSSYILLALEENQQGHLYSIDLPTEEDEICSGGNINSREGIIPRGKESGWIIPNHLRHRWTLILGRSSAALSPLLEELEHVDMFLHDSEHTYENMKWEYQTAWPYLRSRGLLLSHDVDRNVAFQEFCQKVNSNAFFTYGLHNEFGLIVKN